MNEKEAPDLRALDAEVAYFLRDTVEMVPVYTFGERNPQPLYTGLPAYSSDWQEVKRVEEYLASHAIRIQLKPINEQSVRVELYRGSDFVGASAGALYPEALCRAFCAAERSRYGHR
jgi:hypothetical protein